MASQPYVFWKGDKFDSTKLLVLGESAYRTEGSPGEPVPPADVINGIKNHMKAGKDNCPGLTHFTRIFLTVRGPHEENSPKNMTMFFDQIAYVNYIQIPVGNNPRVRPTPEHWRAAWDPLREFLDWLRPDKVLVLGFTTWGNILRAARVPRNDWESYRLPISNAPAAKICVIRHPSSWNRPPQIKPEDCHSHYNEKFAQA